MKNVFVINAHEYYSFSQGKLNRSLVEMAQEKLVRNGYEVKLTTMKDDYEADAEIEKHLWADVVLVQTPVNWMGVPWSFKRYMDLVYSPGIDGRLSDGDGRSRKDPDKQYGEGGVLHGKKYMLSLTFNAPGHAFGNMDQRFFEGKSIDDLFWPMHLNFRFFGMTPLKTFACFDVMKNPDVERDFRQFDAHLETFFPPVS